jgi:hypothetical protein
MPDKIGSPRMTETMVVCGENINPDPRGKSEIHMGKKMAML